MPYIPGEFYRFCERCGQKTLQSKTQKEWNGLWVCNKCYEPRHPQDFVKSRKDLQAVPDPRPEQPDSFLADNAVTADDL